MMTSSIIIALTLTFVYVIGSSHAQSRFTECTDVLTSEGVVTLQNSQSACAPLEEGEGPEALGKKFVVCSNSHVSVISCGGFLRYNVKSRVCTYPRQATCDPSNHKELPQQKKKTPPVTKAVPTTPPPPPPAPKRTTAQRVSAFLSNDRGDCIEVDTSEGPVTLRDGQFACAGPRDSRDDPKGSWFIRCINGRVTFPGRCPGVLRWSTRASQCVWPSQASCSLSGETPERPTVRPSQNIVKPEGRRAVPPPPTERVPVTEDRLPQYKPEPEEDTGSCNSGNCQLPNCFCRGATPEGISTSDTPMFLMLSFDDAVTDELYGGYLQNLLIENKYGLKNPDGCAPRTAFYLSHNYTIYNKVQKLYEAGHEIASHTINHFQPPAEGFSYNTLVNEIVGLRTKVTEGTRDSSIAQTIKGFRSPFLRIPGPDLFDVLQDYGFTYDTSILNTKTWSHQQPYWPYTLDFNDGSECINPPCPDRPYKGMWEVPLNSWIGDNGYPCAMVDACIVGSDLFSASVEEWAAFYRRNYEDYFKENRVPMPIFLHGAMFMRTPNAFTALADFLQARLAESNHVWMATPSMVIDWIKNPMTNSEMISQRWSCV